MDFVTAVTRQCLVKNLLFGYMCDLAAPTASQFTFRQEKNLSELRKAMILMTVLLYAALCNEREYISLLSKLCEMIFP